MNRPAAKNPVNTAGIEKRPIRKPPRHIIPRAIQVRMGKKKVLVWWVLYYPVTNFRGMG